MLIHLFTPGVIDSVICLIALWFSLWGVADPTNPTLLGTLTSVGAVIALAIRIWQTDREVKQLHKVERSTTDLSTESADLRAKRAQVIADVQESRQIVGELRETVLVLSAAHERDRAVIDALRAERALDRNELEALKKQFADQEELDDDGR